MTQEMTSFAPFNFSAELNRALEKMQYTVPSPIQAKTIPYLLEGRDVIGLAQTGTGKTAAFALPILQGLLPDVRGTQALILAPTRELAIQVAEQFELLSAHQGGISVAVLCGGQDYSRQLKQLRGGAQVVVGTPGRIMDHIARKTLSFGNLRMFVLDEADEMLRMGFIEDVETILAALPAKRQIALFSATMPQRIRTIANTYLKDAMSIEIRMETATVKTIAQRFLFVSGYQKPDALVRILAVEDHQGVIVFVRTKNSADEVAEVLQQQGLSAMALHGDITQNVRERIISQFKQGLIEILVATDVAARGLDVDRVTHVINYDIPQDCETYVHRIGRTGRAGRSGDAILFVTPKESRLISTIERHTRQRIEKAAIPSDQAIQEARQQQFMMNITSRLESEHLASYKQMISSYLQETGAKAEDVAAALALLIHKDSPWKKELPAIKTVWKENNFREDHSPKSRSRSPSDRKQGFGASDRRQGFGSSDRKQGFGASDRKQSFEVDERRQHTYRIDVGRTHGVKPGNIVGAIANEAGLQSKQITGLKIHDNHSMVCLPKNMSPGAIKNLSKAWVCGRQLQLTLVEGARA
jgi:ATP-dependent RNA helicase DeaD